MTNRISGNAFYGLEVFGLRLHFSAPGRGSGFPGAAWRGLMGQALFRSTCSFPAPACATCPAVTACAYPSLFKPVADTALPPFWLHDWQRGREDWTVGVRWLGARNGFAIGEWLSALAGDAALSFGGASARLEYATALSAAKPAWRKHTGWITLPAALALTENAPQQTACRVRFVTPLVSKHAGDPLFGALHTRLQRLVQLHGDAAELPRPALPWRCRVMAQKEKRIPLAKRMLTGTEWALELTEIDAAAWPMLSAGVELHAGGQTGMGCGQYEIFPANED
jgi:hypothetical protein